MLRSIARAQGIALALTVTITWVLILPFVGSSTAFAQAKLDNAPQIFDTRKSLPMEPDEEATHDFYINAGPEAGFKKGMFVSVVRLVPVHNPIAARQQATLSVPVGRLQIIHVERGISVGRMDSELTDEDRPTLEFEGIMIGDRVDLDSATMEAPKKKPKPDKSARVEIKVDVKPEIPPAEPAASAPPTTAAVTPEPPKVVPATGPVPASVPSEKASPPAKQPDMVRVPVPAPSTVAGNTPRK